MDNLDLSKLSAKELYSEEVICSIMDEEDPVTREQLHFDLLDRAAEFGERIEKRVEQMWKVADKDRKRKEKDRKKADSKGAYENYTDFGERYPAMKCGNWRADMSGIYNPDAVPENRLACSHPILPAEIITNVEDGTQKVRIAFYQRSSNRWREQIIPKTIIANRSKIPEISAFGIAVTSENAKNLVRYLSEVEQLNYEAIPEVRATAKMGWCEDGFMPYTSELTFDKDGRFDGLFDTIDTCGSRNKWMEFVLSTRVSERIEPRLVMAASLASVLIKPCGLLPFWVDLWGRSGGGKSICGMLAASIWADPEIGKYISKFDSTVSAFEARAGFLNHLPFVIDDTAEVRKRLKDDFSQLIYQLASGEGRERSNTKLGLAHKTTWSNVIICSGETPIITDQLQGGAVNRVIEYEVDEGDIFPDGQAAATLLKNNYGFIGREFIKLIAEMGFDGVTKIQQEIFNTIRNDKYEDKQLRSLSAILAADKIATERIFKDGRALSFAEVEKALTDKDTLSENERCYEYILSECAVNESKFAISEDHIGDCWGFIYHNRDNLAEEYYAILPSVFQRICLSGNFSLKAFCSWAIKKEILLPGDGRNYTKKVRPNELQNYSRHYLIKIPEYEE